MLRRQADASLQRLTTPDSSKTLLPMYLALYLFIRGCVANLQMCSSHLVFTILDEIVSVLFDEA